MALERRVHARVTTINGFPVNGGELMVRVDSLGREAGIIAWAEADGNYKSAGIYVRVEDLPRLIEALQQLWREYCETRGGED